MKSRSFDRFIRIAPRIVQLIKVSGRKNGNCPFDGDGQVCCEIEYITLVVISMAMNVKIILRSFSSEGKKMYLYNTKIRLEESIKMRAVVNEKSIALSIGCVELENRGR